MVLSHVKQIHNLCEELRNSIYHLSSLILITQDISFLLKRAAKVLFRKKLTDLHFFLENQFENFSYTVKCLLVTETIEDIQNFLLILFTSKKETAEKNKIKVQYSEL